MSLNPALVYLPAGPVPVREYRARLRALGLVRKPTPCTCEAYPFPHRAGSGPCRCDDADAPHCPHCGDNGYRVVDVGIGYTEYWGAGGYDSQPVRRCVHCGTEYDYD